MHNHNQVDEYKYSENKMLQYGYTTGTCAAAAIKSAVAMLYSRVEIAEVSLLTPKGIHLWLDVQCITLLKNLVRCAIRKNAGDDPDVTDGVFVYGQAVIWSGEDKPEYCYCHKTKKGQTIMLIAGIGVGRVTKKGLSCPVGYPAINPVPRDMIFFEVEELCKQYDSNDDLLLSIEIPEGAELAKRTFNPRLGIVDGISVLGTTGIVEPMSETALIETIRLEINQQLMDEKKILLITPGNYGVNFVSKEWGLNLEQGIKCSNFIGETIDHAIQSGAEGLLLIGHIGKLVKIAVGMMNTHSKYGDTRMETLSAYAALAGASKEVIASLLQSVTTEGAIRILEQEGLEEETMEYIMQRIYFHLSHRGGTHIHIECIAFSNEIGTLGSTKGALKMMDAWQRERLL